MGDRSMRRDTFCLGIASLRSACLWSIASLRSACLWDIPSLCSACLWGIASLRSACLRVLLVYAPPVSVYC